MDRRQKKTRQAIFQAFRTLLHKKRYDHITVQEIIDAADVGRSTFYAHFETKDSLLDAMCEELFAHIFENSPCTWEGNDNGLEQQLAHTLWHIRDEKNGMAALLLDSGGLFMARFKERVRELFSRHTAEFHWDVPQDFVLNHLVGSFAETVRWWLSEGRGVPPETAARYFMRMTETH